MAARQIATYRKSLCTEPLLIFCHASFPHLEFLSQVDGVICCCFWSLLIHTAATTPPPHPSLASSTSSCSSTSSWKLSRAVPVGASSVHDSANFISLSLD